MKHELCCALLSDAELLKQVRYYTIPIDMVYYSVQTDQESVEINE